MKRVRHTGNRCGFTLVEVLVAMSIFAFGAMALFAMQLNAIDASTQARRLAMATELMQFPIEAWKGTTFADINAISDPAPGWGGTLNLTYNTGALPTYADGDLTTDDGPDVLQKICREWYVLFLKNFDIGRGTMKITIHSESISGNNVNKWADIELYVEWCDNKPSPTGCSPNHKHKVETRPLRFTNNI